MMTVNFTDNTKTFEEVEVGDIFVLEDNRRVPYIRVEEFLNTDDRNHYNAIDLQTGEPDYFDYNYEVITYKNNTLILGR